MIPYISLAFMGGFLIGFGICRDWGLRANGTKTYAKKLIHCLN